MDNIYTIEKIINAIDEGDLEWIKKFVNHYRTLYEPNSRLNIKDEHGCSLIYYSIYIGEDNIAKFLINTGLVDINGQNEHGDSPLHIVCGKSCDEDLLYLLLEKGANPNIQNILGETPLMILLQHHNDIFYIKKLIEYGADVNIKSIKGDTALIILFKRYSFLTEEFCKIFLEAGANPNEKDYTGTDAMTYCYSREFGNDSLKLLIEYGGDVNKTLYDMIIYRNDIEMILFIEEYNIRQSSIKSAK